MAIGAGLAALITGLASSGTKIATTAMQNKYNSPLSQVRRIRKAGLPAAAIGNNIANTQSEPLGDLGVGQIGAVLQQFISTQKTQEEIEALKAQVRNLNLEGDRAAEENRFLLSGEGESIRSTNLTRNLKNESDLKEAEKVSKNLLNKFQEMLNDNQSWEINEKNSILTAQLRNLEGTAKGIDIENSINSIRAEYQRGMSDEQLKGAILQNNLAEKNISGAELDNIAKTLRNAFDSTTFNDRVSTVSNETVKSFIESKTVKMMFEDENIYRQFKRNLYAKLGRDNGWNPITGVENSIELALIAALNAAGAAPNSSNSSLLNMLR